MACPNGKSMFPIVKTPSLPPNALEGKVAFITGGGTGLGKAMATAFSRLGATVAIGARRLDVLEATANEISSTTGRRVLALSLDVKRPETIAKAADEIERQFGLPDIIVNNAAGNFISASERLSPNAFKTIVDIVLNGSAFVTLEFGKRLIKAKKGAAFLNITTPYARNGAPFVTPSGAAKAGVENMCKSLAAEWGKYGLRFNCIAPGPIYTPGAFDRLDPTGGRHEGGGESASAGVPAGRFGETEELANLASYIVSDWASWMNGTLVDFDGGQQRFAAGNTMGAERLHEVTPEQWDQLEGMIRSKTGKTKSKL